MESITSRIDAINELAAAIEDMGNVMGRLKTAYKSCVEEGMSPAEIRDEMAAKVSDDERAMFLQQWPMLSMMLAAL